MTTYKSTLSPAWTEAEVEQLFKLWNAGRTGTEIAKVLGNGRTRNAVIGKVHRMQGKGIDLAKRPSPIHPKTRATNEIKVAQVYHMPDKPSHLCVEHNCGGVTVKKKDYCQYHYDLYYSQPDRKKEPIRWNTSRLPR